MRIEQIAEGVELYLGDCLEILPTLGKFDSVVTDPPYPDHYTELFKYDPTTTSRVIEWIGDTPALVFWSAKMDLECKQTAIHIWDKKTGFDAQYERIFEINGNKRYRVANHYLINSTMAARYTGDEFTGHPTQKPVALIKEILGWMPSGNVIDPFMGSGTTGVAAINLGRKFTGIEIESKYFDIACQRISAALKQTDLFIDKPRPAEQIECTEIVNYVSRTKRGNVLSQRNGLALAPSEIGQE